MQRKNKNSKKIFIPIIIVVLALVIGGSIYFVRKLHPNTARDKVQTTQTRQLVQTMIASGEYTVNAPWEWKTLKIDGNTAVADNNPKRTYILKSASNNKIQFMQNGKIAASYAVVKKDTNYSLTRLDTTKYKGKIVIFTRK